MGRRYYCDFCNRGFADTPFSRRKHINSVQHQRLRKLHYDSFKDPAALLAEERQKQPCKRFFQYGHCDFGVHCRYSHVDYNSLHLQESQAHTVRKEREPDLEEWLKSWRLKHKVDEDDSGEKEKEVEVFILPANFPPVHQLPPSLLPPPPGGFPTTSKVEWG